MPIQQLSERPATSATRHEFRGATIEEAIANATKALGPDIRIVEANRIRRGGVGGFFATDLGVEVVVEADTPRGTTKGTTTEPNRSAASDDLLDEMRRLGIDVEELESRPTSTSSPAPGLDALIDDVQSDERSFAVRTFKDRAEPTRSPSFLATLEHEMQADRDRPAEISELPRRQRPGGTGDGTAVEPVTGDETTGDETRSTVTTGTDTTGTDTTGTGPGNQTTDIRASGRLATQSLAVSSELAGPIHDVAGPTRSAAAHADDDPPTSITGLATRLGAGIQLAELPRSRTRQPDPSDRQEQSAATAASMAAHIEAIADLPPATRAPAATAAAEVADQTMDRPEAETAPAAAPRVSEVVAETVTDAAPTGNTIAGSDPTTIGREIAADAARSVITQLAQLEADDLRPADLRSITVSVSTPTGSTISISAELGEVTP